MAITLMINNFHILWYPLEAWSGRIRAAILPSFEYGSVVYAGNALLKSSNIRKYLFIR